MNQYCPEVTEPSDTDLNECPESVVGYIYSLQEQLAEAELQVSSLKSNPLEFLELKDAFVFGVAWGFSAGGAFLAAVTYWLSLWGVI